MALDFEKLKQNLSIDKIKAGFAKTKTASSGNEPAGQSAVPAWVLDNKRGLDDVQAVLQEGKFSLFVRQVVMLLVIFLLVRYGCGKLAERKGVLLDQMSKINIEQLNKDDYLENKQHLLRLEPLFPDYAQKNEWLLQRLIDVFNEHQMSPDINGNVSENASASTYTVMSHPVTFQRSFRDMGQFLADVENGDDFLRISEITVTKLVAPESLGENTVTAKFNTVFPKNKYASVLFKDYAQQMEAIKKQQQAAAGEQTK